MHQTYTTKIANIAIFTRFVKLKTMTIRDEDCMRAKNWIVS